MVDEKKLLKELEAVKFINTISGHSEWNNGIQQTENRIKQLKEELPEINTGDNGWNPCDERLPENDEEVLCWYEYRIMQGTHEGEMVQRYGIGYYLKQFKSWGGEVSCGKHSKVIAWKPLPSAYKPEGGKRDENRRC